MAQSLSTQLESLERERQRLEELLMLDANWRALRQLEAREAAGEPLESVDAGRLRAGLEQSLSANRIYAARAKLIETIELLSAGIDGKPGPVKNTGSGFGSGPGGFASRIVMLSGPSGEQFRARLRMKAVEAAAAVTTRHVVAPSEPEPGEVGAPRVTSPPAGNIVQQATPETKAAVPDPLMLIAGLGSRAVEMLHDGGVTRFEQIARWSSVEAIQWRSRLNGAADGSTGWWIEQAAMLAAGHPTRFSVRVRRGEYAVLVHAPEAEPPRGSVDAVPRGAAESTASADLQAAVPRASLTETRHDETSPQPAADPEVKFLVAVEPRSSIETAVQTAVQIETRAPSQAAPQTQDPPQDTVCEHKPAPVRRRLKTADEIARALAAHEAAIVTAASPVAEAVSTVRDPEPNAEPRPPTKRGPYMRPRRGSRPQDAAESDVTVVTRERSEKRSLLGRLKDIADPQRFEAGTYAAYRGSVEEASVTIVRPAHPGGSSEPAGAAASPVAPMPPGVAKSKRFLKALTGRE